MARRARRVCAHRALGRAQRPRPAARRRARSLRPARRTTPLPSTGPSPLTSRKDPSLSDHFRFRHHPEHGFVATAAPSFTPHLAEWLLVREQFEPVPFSPGLYRLIEPNRDGLRRTRQAVHDLRNLGYRVRDDSTLDPAHASAPPRPTASNDLADRRSRIARAAAVRPSRITALANAAPSAPPAAGKAPAAGQGRSR
ncbi:hypothetical protein [Streptomyces caniscabiei]|uniref:hypothetical protein n=1 Tax=Streptomyces caniscabiei TaxID=2746961 RepID=UPI0038F6F67C